MAELLYRIGRGAARRAWWVVTGWVLVLVLAGVGFLLGRGTLTTSFDIPNTASSQVTDELAAALPQYAGASGTVVFATEDGSAFTADQQAAISALVASAADLPDVAAVVDPFTMEAQRAAQAEQLASGQAQLDAGAAQLDDGQTQLDAGQAQLDAGQAQLDEGRTQLEAGQEQVSAGLTQAQAGREQAVAAGAPADQVAVLDAQIATLTAQQQQLAAQAAALDSQQAQIDAQQEQIDAQQAELDAGREQLETQGAQLADGTALLELAAPIRLVSEDGSTAQATVQFDVSRLELQGSSKDAVDEHFTTSPIDGVEVAISSEISQDVPSVFGVPEAVGLTIAVVVLLVMLGTAVAAAVPVVTAITGVAIGVAVALAFSGVVSMSAITPILGVMLGLAVGIDYALFILNRHRHQLAAGAEVDESIGLANGTAGNAVVFAGSTVVVALLALNVTGIPFLGLMGDIGALCVAVAVLVATSLVPAILGLLGQRVLDRRGRERLAHHETTAPAPMRTWRAVATTLAAVVGLGVLAVPAASMRLGLPDGSSEPAGSSAHRAFVLVEDAFGAGANATLLVTAHLPAGTADEAALTHTQLEVAQRIAAVDDVVAVAPVAVSDDGTLAAFQVVPAEGPNAESTEQVVRSLRALPDADGDGTLGVAGQAAMNIDISESLADVLPIYLVVVVGLSLIITVVVFRSLVVPLVATGGFVLSLVATLGIVVAVFQWGWLASVFGIPSAGPILSFLPLLFAGILFGLAMDYQLFLATGMREAFVHGAPARVAVMQGFRAGRAVVTAAALIMISVFGGFIFNESTIVRPLGFGLAVGVLLDAFVVRLALMPAVLHLVGRGAWWLPRWLDRILPKVDVEGAALERRHHGKPAVDAAESAGAAAESEA